MREEKQQAIIEALRHGTQDTELDEILRDDLKVIEPIVDEMVVEARDYYFKWTMHAFACPGGPACTCGLTAAIENRRKL